MTCWMRGTFDANEVTMNSALGPGKDVGESLADGAFGRRVPGTLGVGAVGEQRENAFVADAGNRGKIRGLAVERRLIELEVTGMKDRCLPACGSPANTHPATLWLM